MRDRGHPEILLFIWEKTDLTVLGFLYGGIVTFLGLQESSPPAQRPGRTSPALCPLVGEGGISGEPRKVLFTSGKRVSLDLGKAEQGLGAGRDGTAQGRAKSRKNSDSQTRKF